MNLYDLIKEKKAKVAIIGMGYVGLPHIFVQVKFLINLWQDLRIPI